MYVYPILPSGLSCQVTNLPSGLYGLGSILPLTPSQPKCHWRDSMVRLVSCSCLHLIIFVCIWQTLF